MAGQDGNPGNPLGLQTPAYNASFAFFLLFMGTFQFPSLPFPFRSSELGEVNLTSGRACVRTRLPRLPHLLPPHQRRFLSHLPHPHRCLRLSRGRILEPGPRVRECGEHNGREESGAARRSESTIPIPNSPLFSSPLAKECCPADSCVSQGRRRLHIRHVLSRLVDLLRHHARLPRLSL